MPHGQRKPVLRSELPPHFARHEPAFRSKQKPFRTYTIDQICADQARRHPENKTSIAGHVAYATIVAIIGAIAWAASFI